MVQRYGLAASDGEANLGPDAKFCRWLRFVGPVGMTTVEQWKWMVAVVQPALDQVGSGGIVSGYSLAFCSLRADDSDAHGICFLHEGVVEAAFSFLRPR